jgi:aspartyl-tRNA(Asn)/glutamyl-tRNA(Gln) amidotransferase subunit B
VAEYPDPKKVGNWIQTELFRLQKESGDEEAGSALLTPSNLVELLELVDRGTLSAGSAKQVFEETYRTGKSPIAIVEERGLSQVSDEGALNDVVAQVIAANPQPVVDYRAGKTAAIGRLVGEVMKATRGRANPGIVGEILRRHLDN